MVGHDGSGPFSVTAKIQIFGLVPPLPDLSCHLASPATNMPVLRNSVASDSLGPHGLQPTRLLRPWGSPGKNTGVGCHFLLQCMKVKSESEVAWSCPTLWDPMDCSPPGSSVHGIFQARVLEWGAIALSMYTILQLLKSSYSMVLKINCINIIALF